MVKDFRSYLEEMQERFPAEFIVVEREMDARFEIVALIKEFEARGRHPVLYCKNVKNSAYPLVANIFGSRDRIGHALGVPGRDLKWEFLRRDAQRLPTTTVASAPCQEVVMLGDEVNLYDFPALHAHEADVGPYFTTALTVVRDPQSGIRNASFNRLMVVDRKTVHVHLTPGRHLETLHHMAEERDEPLAVAFAIGVHPSLALGSLSIIPLDEDELEVMSAMYGSSLEMAPCKTNPLEVPAHAEIVLEGEILPKVRGSEGPFSDFTGYATPARQRQVINIKAITHRQNPIYHGLYTGSAEHRLLESIPREVYLYKAVKNVHPAVKDLVMPISGCGLLHCYVSIEKRQAGQAKRVGLTVLGSDQYTKHVFVVDHDIDLYDDKQILWAMATRFQGNEDILFAEGVAGTDLDPSTKQDGVGCKLVFDLTADPFLKDYQPRAKSPDEVAERIRIEDFDPHLRR